MQAGSKEEKRTRMARMQNDFDQRAKEVKMLELETRKLRTSNTKLQNELKERDAIIESQRERIIQLGEQMRVNDVSYSLESSDADVDHDLADRIGDVLLRLKQEQDHH